MRKISLYITDEQYLKLKEESKRTGAPIAELVRRGIDNYLVKSDGRKK